MTGRFAIVGAGWAGAAAAHRLVQAEQRVDVFERSQVVGGHSRCEQLEGVVYEPNGAHIFHTSDAEIAAFVQRHGLSRPYAHSVSSEVYLTPDADQSVQLSWPPQIDELQQLPSWETISRELSELPDEPSGDDFETYVLSMIGPTLFDMFIRDYTIKQWDMMPSELSSSFAPRRIELRSDGYRRLFRDRWEFFATRGVNQVVERVLEGADLIFGTEVLCRDLDRLASEYDAIVITAPLDAFLERPSALSWRGVELRSRVIPVSRPLDTITARYVINHPSLRVPYTRTVETKHATGQSILATVISEEFPGSDDRHYPIPTPTNRYEKANHRLKSEIRERSALPVYFCGRLANYQYINQDEAIRQGFDVADELLATGVR